MVHLDRLYWRSGWVELTRAEWLLGLEKALSQPEWIMDGNYGGTLALRLQSADAVIFLDYPTRICLTRALRRIFRGWHKERPDMAPGCPERLDLGFLAYIASFRAQKRPAVLKQLEEFSGQVWHLTSPGQTASLMATITMQSR